MADGAEPGLPGWSTLQMGDSPGAALSTKESPVRPTQESRNPSHSSPPGGDGHTWIKEGEMVPSPRASSTPRTRAPV